MALTKSAGFPVHITFKTLKTLWLAIEPTWTSVKSQSQGQLLWQESFCFLPAPETDMTTHTGHTHSWRFLTRAKLLVLAVTLAPIVASSEPMGGAFHVTIVGEGGVTNAPITGFDLQLNAKDPSYVALLLPAVQSAREAARRAREAACSGQEFERVIIEGPPGTPAQPYVRIEMENVSVTSYSLSGASGNSPATEEISLNFEKVEWTRGRNGDVVYYDCSSGRCVCESFETALP